MKTKTLYYTLNLILICMTAGCVMTGGTKEWAPVQQGQRSFVHIVRWPGEDLALISEWYTGTDKNRERLADNNPNINPRQLGIGDRVYIPGDLLITRDRMPEEYVNQSISGPEVPAQEPVTVPDTIEKTEPEPVAVQDKTEKTESGPAKKAPQKKKSETEPEKAVEEEKEPSLFGPK